MCTVITSDIVKTENTGFFRPENLKKAILVAVSTLMFLGMILAYAIGAPWFIVATFFLLTLSPLFPLGKAVDDQRNRILE